ncbi:hypothetical protein MTR67_001240 [Solanum verrucosum]|uniref:Uncharacterized protein n=1 Tax=Solanum verrucosum TaxID=315347 RepID=A0AAF0TC89_SOLVR|nr:hypothetical protein MTR67_001240 [Solanum verrucosum]
MILISARERVVKVLKDDDINFLYQPSKVNVVTDSLSKLSRESTAYVEEEQRELARDVHRLARLGVRLIDSVEGGIELTSGAELSLVSEVEGEKDSNPILLKLQARCS